MADVPMTLMEYLGRIGMDLNGDFLSQGTQLLAQLAIELEAEQQIGARRYERNPQRRTYRNGHRKRVWETRVGGSRCALQSCGKATVSPAFWNQGDEPNGRS